ncbi:MAG TPA: YciI family protein [Longimicrobiales bacterium]
MRYLAIWKTVERNQPPTQEEMERMNGLIQQMLAEGTLITTEGCLPSALGARVRRSGDEVTVTDGPFTESKEVVGGFAILEARDKAHAIELTRHFLAVAGEGESEIRQLYEAPAVPEARRAEKSAA